MTTSPRSRIRSSLTVLLPGAVTLALVASAVAPVAAASAATGSVTTAAGLIAALAGTDSSIVLGADITVADATLPVSHTSTLDLNGFSLTTQTIALAEGKRQFETGGPEWITFTISDSGTTGHLTAIGAAGLPGIAVTRAQLAITGGTITATGTSKGAGIGSYDHGNETDAGWIVISGGTVSATGGPNSAGIGGGDDSQAGQTLITGGQVTATGGTGAAAIGAGYSGMTPPPVNFPGGAIRIGAAARVTTITSGSGSSFAPLGFDFTSSVEINGAVTVPPGSTLAAPQYKTITIGSTGTITGGGRVTGQGTISNGGSISGVDTSGASIVGNNYSVGFDSNAFDASPAGQDAGVLAATFSAGAGSFPSPPTRPGATFLGWNTSFDGTGTAFSVDSVLTSGETVYAQWGPATPGGAEPSAPPAPTETSSAWRLARFVATSSPVTLAVDLTIPHLVVPDTLTIDLNGHSLTVPGIEVSKGMLTISDGGTGGALHSSGGNAGIETAGGNVTITGGTIDASSSSGPGIGVVFGHGSLRVTGGTVTASGGSGSAGVGSAADTDFRPAGGTVDVTVSGGSLTAYGSSGFSQGRGGAGIGSGSSDLGIGGSLTIGEGAHVTAYGGAGAPAVGGVSSDFFDMNDFHKISVDGTLTIPRDEFVRVDPIITTGSSPSNVFTIGETGLVEGAGTLRGTGTIANAGVISVAEVTVAVSNRSYAVSFDSAASDAAPATTVRHAYGPTLASSGREVPAPPVRPGQIFTGWALDGSPFTATTTVAADTTVAATWNPVAALLVATPPTAIAGDPVALSVEGADAAATHTADMTTFASWSSSVASDTFTATGVTMTSAGTHLLTATVGDVTTTVSINVVPADYATIVPTPVDGIVAGTPMALTVTLADRFGNAIVVDPASLETWIDNDKQTTGSVTLTKAGTHRMLARYQGGQQSAWITFTVVPAALASISTAPAVAAPVAGQKVPFTVTGFDRYGNSRGSVAAASTLRSSIVGDVVSATTVRMIVGGRTHVVTARSGLFSATARVLVAKDVATIEVTAPAKARAGKKFTVSVTLAPGAGQLAAKGTVRLYYSSTKYVRISATSRSVSFVSVPGVGAGTRTLRAVFYGSESYRSATSAGKRIVVR